MQPCSLLYCHYSPAPAGSLRQAQDKRQTRRLNKLNSTGFGPSDLDVREPQSNDLAIQAERDEQLRNLLQEVALGSVVFALVEGAVAGSVGVKGHR